MFEKNQVSMTVLYDEALEHGESFMNKIKKKKYNQEYYQKHKDYWKQYYKTGKGSGRMLSPEQRPTTKTETKSKNSAPSTKPTTRTISTSQRQTTTTNPSYTRPYGPVQPKYGPPVKPERSSKLHGPQTTTEYIKSIPGKFNKKRDEAAEKFVGNAVKTTQNLIKYDVELTKKAIDTPALMAKKTSKVLEDIDKLTGGKTKTEKLLEKLGKKIISEEIKYVKKAANAPMNVAKKTEEGWHKVDNALDYPIRDTKRDIDALVDDYKMGLPSTSRILKKKEKGGHWERGNHW